jgi:phosphatidylglycerol---prolipoprotein diacylglyceryl transferase
LDYITWDVDRMILHIYGPFGIRWYSLMFLAAFLFGLWGFNKMLEREGKDSKYSESLLTYVIFGTIIGARLGHCLFYQPMHYLSNPIEILKVWEGGLASHGGTLGIFIAVLLFSRKNKQFPLLWLADRISIFVIVTGGFVRIGNLFNSEIIGKVTTVPWAFIFAKVDNLPRHPAQLYEAIGYISLGAILYLVYLKTYKSKEHGRLFGLTIMLGFLFRALIEQFKVNQVRFEDTMLLNLGQLLSLPYIIVGLFFALGWHLRFCKNNFK